MQVVAAPVGEGRGGGDGNGAEDTGTNSTCKSLLWEWQGCEKEIFKGMGENPHPLSP